MDTSNHDWVFLCDSSGVVISIGRETLSAIGMGDDEASGMKATAIMRRLPLVRQDVHGKLDEFVSMAMGKDVSCLQRIESAGADGARVVLELSSSALVGGRGGFVLTVRDVTEAVRIEEILERYAEGLTVLYEISNAFLSKMDMGDVLNDSLDMVRAYYSADTVQILVPANREDSLELELLAASGYDAIAGSVVPLRADSIEGNSIINKCPVVVPDLGGGGPVARAEFTDNAGSGFGVPMMVDGKALGVLSIIYNSTGQMDTAELWYLNVLSNMLAVYAEKERSLLKLTESESFLNSILESIGEGVVVLDPDLKVITANKRYLDSVGLESIDVEGMYCYQASHGNEKPCGKEEHACPVRKVFETGRPFSDTHVHVDARGKRLNMQITAYPIMDKGGGVKAVVETLMDTTDSLRLEQDLEKRIRELEQFYDMAVGRELKMIELKEEVERLKSSLHESEE